MKTWLKIVLAILGVILLTGFILFQIFLKSHFVDEPQLSSSLQTVKIKVDNQEREYHWYAPKESAGINTILYVFHGSTSNGLAIRQQTAYEFDQIADEEGMVVVYPTGFENHWNDCRASADYAANTNNIDDFAFLQALEEKLTQDLGLDLKYRFAAGHSNGGHFCFKLALEHPEWIDGIAPISANLPIDDNLDCKKSAQFVPICLINGTKDQINPYQGGLVEIMGNASRGTVLSTDATMAYWTSLGNCKHISTKDMSDDFSDDDSFVKKVIWTCDSTIQAINYEVVNGGHTIPHPESRMPKLLGTTNRDLNAPRAIWEFFSELVEQDIVADDLD